MSGPPPGRVLVTGAFGNLGLAVIRELTTRGHPVSVLVRDRPANRRVARRWGGLLDGVTWGDVRTADVDALVAPVDAVVHLAGVLPPRTETSPELAEDINVRGTMRLIDAVERAAHAPLFVYPSSVTVYGLPSLPILRTADEPVHPSDHYTRHKIAIETRLREGSARFAILRVGVSVDARTLTTDPGTFRQLLRTAPDNPLEHVHPADVATAMAACVDAPDAVGKVLLIGGGEGCRITQHEFLDAVFAAAGLRLPRDLLGGEAFYTHWMDTAESNAILGYQTHTFADYRDELRPVCAGCDRWSGRSRRW